MLLPGWEGTGRLEPGLGGGSELAAVIATDLTWLCPPASKSECSLGQGWAWGELGLREGGGIQSVYGNPLPESSRDCPIDLCPQTNFFPNFHLLKARCFLYIHCEVLSCQGNPHFQPLFQETFLGQAYLPSPHPPCGSYSH